MTSHAKALRNRARDGGDAERGAVLVLVVLLATVLVGVAALAVDLAGLRLDRRSNRAAADFAALTAAATSAGDAPGGCERAQAAVQANLDVAGTPTWSTSCGIFATACDPAVPRQAVASVGPIEVTITHPVPDGHELMIGTGGTPQSLVPAIDGTACERMAVRVESQRDFFFARILGFASGSTAAHAVSRSVEQPPDPGEAVALLLLDPARCEVLTASGNGTVVVDESVPHADGARTPGNIHLDSDGSGCSSNSHTLDASGTNSHISSRPSSTSGLPGRIALRALPAGATACTGNACEQADVEATPPRVHPTPIPTSHRIGRAVVDHRYNCKSSYTFPSHPWWNGTVPGCTTGTGASIDQLQLNYQASLPSWETWSTYSGPCSPNADQVLSGNWFVNCPNLSLSKNFTVTGKAVFAGDVAVKSDGTLRVGDGVAPSMAYFRNGSFSKAGQATVDLPQVTVYLHNGGVDFSGGGGLRWTGPSSGPLEGLALWSESHTHQHGLSGGAVNDVYGVFYAPNAGYANNTVFSLTGNGNQTQFQAQFITYRLNVSGNGALVMQAPPIITLPQPTQYETRLIR